MPDRDRWITAWYTRDDDTPYRPGVTVAIPTIPPRRDLLQRALDSVARQTTPAAAVSVVYDLEHRGAWWARNEALAAVRTEWTAFLDDDDALMPGHIEHLLRVHAITGADMVWGWYEVIGGGDPFPDYRGRQWDPAEPHVIPITYMARTELLHRALADGCGFQPDQFGAWDLQDKPIIDHLVAHGAVLHANPSSTWYWHHHGRNTSGQGDRW